MPVLDRFARSEAMKSRAVEQELLDVMSAETATSSPPERDAGSGMAELKWDTVESREAWLRPMM